MVEIVRYSATSVRAGRGPIPSPARNLDFNQALRLLNAPAMSFPRPVIPGATSMITRRCTQRQYLLAPSNVVAEVFLYCLAVAAARTGVLVHALTVMSNHYHLIATDPDGRLPEFYSWLHEFVAKALNAHYGRWENFWASEPTSCVRLVNPEDVLDKIVYTLTNPVSAGLVSSGDQWPGLRLFTPGPRRIKRPAGFFRANGPLPDEVELNIVSPPIAAPNEQAALTMIKNAVEVRETAIRTELRQSGRRFLGVAGVRAQRHDDSPRTVEPRRELSPRVACKSTWHRIEILRRSKDFVRAYRAALARWRASIRDVVFPIGTWLMAKRHQVLIAASTA